MYAKLFLHGIIFCLSIFMSACKPSVCFWKRVISIKWRNKLLIHNISLTVHRKSACCLHLLVFLEIWVIAPFWHWRTSSCERALSNRRVKSKIVRKSSLNLTFGSCLISDFARPNSSKAVLVQVFLRFEIVNFNNNFVFCIMSSFCSMAREADWILTRKILKRTNVFYPVCLKKYWKKLDKHVWRVYFVNVARLHTTAYLKWITPC